jgi:Rrf2 family protein
MNGAMRISGKADYAVRAMIELGTHGSDEQPVKASEIAKAQDIPMRFLEHILTELKRNGLVMSRPGASGGYWLGRPAEVINIAEVIRATDGVLAGVRGETPSHVAYKGSAEPLQKVWMALRSNVRDVLESVSLADVAAGRLPEHVLALAARPDAEAGQ